MGGKSLVSHWNLLVDLCDTEYLIMASDDDVYEPTFLEEIDKLVQKYPNVDILRAKAVRLENGKEVPVKITNVLDAAGNETVLTNENITETEKYGHVIYDNQAPEMEVLRLTNVSRKDENGAWLQVAKAGDIVVSFYEEKFPNKCYFER